MIKVERPFPYKTDQDGNRPTGNSADLNRTVELFYDNWKDDFIVKSITFDNCYYISTGGGTNVKADTITVSEGHGYGMITVALMAGYDEDSKSIFDGMFNFFDIHRSVINSSLPSWQVRGEVGKYETDEVFPSATDGDFDIAYSLLLADKQWGSNGSINYLEEAKWIIEGIWESDIRHDNHRILLGDWVKGEEVDEKYENSTRPSDWMAAHFREFEKVSPNHEWNKVIDRIYNLSAAVRNKKTGLLPDFVVGDTPTPAEPNFLEKFSDGDYGANACRVPWRIGMDYIQFSDKNAKEFSDRLMNWLDESCISSIKNSCCGYKLDGTKLYEDCNSGDPRGMFASPFMVAASVSGHQEFLDSSWNFLSKYREEEGYYSNSITMLCLIAVSGNWWSTGE